MTPSDLVTLRAYRRKYVLFTTTAARGRHGRSQSQQQAMGITVKFAITYIKYFYLILHPCSTSLGTFPTHQDLPDLTALEPHLHN